MTRHAFERDDYQLSCYETGSGTPVVLIHGYPLDHTMWRAQIEALRPHCRVIAPDLRGFGQSTLAAGDAAAGIEMAQYAADVAFVLDELRVKQPAILCGFSMGGYVLWQFLRQYPQRVQAIMLCDTKATADSAEARDARLAAAEEVLKTGAGPVADSMLPKLLAPGTLANRPDVAREVGDLIRRTAPEAIAAAQRGMARRPDVTADLPAVSVPALVLVGIEDAISSPPEMRGVSEALPQANYVEVADAGHMTTMENPSAVSDALVAFVEGFTG